MLALLIAVGPARPPIVGVAHIALRTSDRARARAFYGGILGFARVTRPGGDWFIVDPHQAVEIVAAPAPNGDRLINIAFETTDAQRLRDYLAGFGATVPPRVRGNGRGGVGFTVRDPAGHVVEFVQYAPEEAARRRASRGISRHILHVGFVVRDRAAEDRFYRDLLGFREIWHGGMRAGETDWVDMEVPDGADWLEYMLNVGSHPDPGTLGVMNHLALAESNVRATVAALRRRGLAAMRPALPRAQAAHLGRDGKWQAGVFDPDGTRIELMNPVPSRPPCCAPFTGRSARAFRPR